MAIGRHFGERVIKDGFGLTAGKFKMPMLNLNRIGVLLSELLLVISTTQTAAFANITSAFSATINAGTDYTESSPAYMITTDSQSPWFDAYNLPSGFYINRTNGIIYGKTDLSGTYSIPISVTSDFQTVNATLLLNIQEVAERLFTVTNLSGNANQSGSLPWAINQANQSTIPTRINFNIDTSEGLPPYRIQLRIPSKITSRNYLL